jgi:chemotaxis protein CheX
MIETEKIVEYTRTATTEVCATMLGLELEAAPVWTDQDAPAVSDGVMALVGIAGPWIGTGVISCTAAAACEICGRMLSMQADAVNEEVLDAVGEVANMIFGNFKSMIEEHLGPLGLSIPTVIYGRNFTSHSVGKHHWLVLPFKSKNETIEIRVCLSRAKKPMAPKAGFLHPVETVS